LLNLLFKQTMDALALVLRRVSLVPVAQQLSLLGFRKQRDFSQLNLGLRRKDLEHVLKVL